MEKRIAEQRQTILKLQLWLQRHHNDKDQEHWLLIHKAMLREENILHLLNKQRKNVNNQLDLFIPKNNTLWHAEEEDANQE